MSSAPSAIQSLLEEYAEKWRGCENLPDRDLLRLAVLRELVHGLHAEKSRFLSQGNRESASSMRSTESTIEELKNCKPLVGDLLSILDGKEKLKKRTRLLPDSLFSILDREKLERYDRQWEAVLASEAISQGWRVWSLETRVQIPVLENWNRRLIEQLWPHGIVLFIESVEHAQEQESWLGRWICLMHPKFKAASEITLDLSGWPGSHSPPSWRLLFSPKSA